MSVAEPLLAAGTAPAAATRTAVVWVPDWPVVAAATAAGHSPAVPVAVQDARGIVAVGPTARRAGVRRGMRRRHAQEACPGLVLLPVDDARDARFFEPVATAVEDVVAGLEVARPGLLLLPAEGAARFYGSEADLVRLLVERVADATGHECHVGIADGVLAAVLAAREDLLVPSGRSAQMLAPRPLRDLVHVAVTPERATVLLELVDLWDRLGVRRIGDLTALDAHAVASRFGAEGVWAQRVGRGEDLRPPARRRPEADVEATCELDPPAVRIDTAAFAARRLAAELHAALVARGATCARLRITAWRGDGREHVRTWRTDDAALGGLTAARITDRVRWQLEGWLTADAPDTEDGHEHRSEDDAAGIVRLLVTAEDLLDAGQHQEGLWGSAQGSSLRALRALDRVQGLLGADGVLAARLQGGRTARDRVSVVPWGEEPPPLRPLDRPWPGALPSPAPTRVLPEPVEVRLLDASGRPVVVDRRLAASGEPAHVRALPPAPEDAGTPVVGRHVRGDARPVARPRRAAPPPEVPAGEVVAWAGPWPLAQRWWREDAERLVHVQVVVRTEHDETPAVLLAGTAGRWWWEASYD
ncbi:DNA polymerase Y family protein [Sanguibacter sp. HDW7]|uniref:DNA polymerase Y family protein n=1 Tax=Sanguibacter sp. HDW7 TaxID=2714931 RepID=UPI00140A9394|nr:DNA polymerase Y family protein [Sanguibacter sp. HDW7]QIK83412.1 DNA polymerase Y family protein [Sanguibacter sp. HDW7]